MSLRYLGFSSILLLAATRLSAQFGAGQTIHPFVNNPDLRVADIDMDGDLDLFGVFDGDHLKWFENSDGLGTFSTAQLILDLSDDCMLVKLADVDGDLAVDILLVEEDEDNVLIYRNDGSGSFTLDGTLTLGSEPKAMAVADINGDGHTDVLVTLNLTEGAGIGIFFGSDDGFGDLQTSGQLHTGPASQALQIGDVDLVGGLDLILVTSDDVVLLARNVDGDGLNWNVAPLDILGGQPGYPYRRPQLLDIDDDGDLDLGEIRGSSVHWLRNELDEGGVLTFEENVIEPWTTAGDGAFGRSICGTGAMMVYVPNNPSLAVRWNSFLPQLGDFPYSNTLPTVPRGRRPLLADFNGDGRDDLVMEVSGELRWFENTVTNDAAPIELPMMDTLCAVGAPVELPTAVPAGGMWYGQQVSNGLLFRSNLPGTMDLPLLHAVYPEGGCPLAAADTLRLIQGPVITNTVPSVICSADAPIQMTSVPTDVTWFGLDGGSVIDPAVWNGGYVVCEYNDATGQMCSNLVGPIQRWNSLPAELAAIDPMCSTDAIANITVLAAPPFNVNWEGPVLNATSFGAQFDPSIGPGTYTIILNAEAFGPNQCRNSDTIQVVVGATPEIVFEPTGIYCVDGGAFDLIGAEPAGGVWSGIGVSAGQLDPAVVGEGTHLINYFVASPEGCGAQASSTIVLSASALVEWNADDLLLCTGDGPIQFSATPAGGTWNENVDPEGFFHVEGLSAGLYPVIYSYTDPRGCTLDHTTVEVQVGAPKDVSIMEVERLCLTTPAFDLIGSAEGVWSGDITGVGNSVVVDPAILGVGNWTVTLTVSPEGECPGEATTQLVVDVCAGVMETLDAELSAWPVPFSDRTTVRFGDLHVDHVDLLDATGKRILSRSFGGSRPVQLELDLASFADGVYLLHATGEKGTARLRLVKAH